MPEESTLNIQINLDKAKKDLSSLARGLDKVEKEGNQAAKSVKKMGKQAVSSSKGFGALKTAIAAVFTGAILRNFVTTIATFQSLENSLGVVFNSMERGIEVFKDIQTAALTTPFSVEALTESVIKLRASGIEPTIAQMTLFSDVASITGDAVGSLQAITDLFSRTVSGGLGLIDLNRLGDKGIPVFAILAEKLGVTRLEIAGLGKTAEGAATILDALTEGLEERFGGASAQAAKLLQTTISNLGDAWDAFLKSLGDAGGLVIFTTTLATVSSTLDFFRDNLDLVAIAATGLAVLALPALISGVKLLTLAIAANPIGLLVVAITAAIAVMWNFRRVIFEALVKVWEVTLPNAMDTTLRAFLHIRKGIIDVVNVVLGSLERLGNKLISETPDFLKSWLGIGGAPFSFQIDTTEVISQLDFLEKRIADRINNFKLPPPPSFLLLDKAEEDVVSVGGLRTDDSLTGINIGIKLEEKEKEKVIKDREKKLEATREFLRSEEEILQIALNRRQDIVSDSFERGLIDEETRNTLMTGLRAKFEEDSAQKELEQRESRIGVIQDFLRTEEEQLQLSFNRRQDIVADAFEMGVIGQEDRNQFMLELQAKHQDSLTAIEEKGWTDRQKFAAKSTQDQTKQVIGELIHLTQGVAQNNKAMFKINKIAATANALISGYASFNKTMEVYPYPLNVALASLGALATGAQVQAIRATTFTGGGGGTTPSAAGSVPTINDTPLQPSQSQEVGRQITITIEGNVFANDDFREAIVDAIETAEDNDEIRLVNAN